MISKKLIECKLASEDNLFDLSDQVIQQQVQKRTLNLLSHQILQSQKTLKFTLRLDDTNKKRIVKEFKNLLGDHLDSINIIDT